MNFMTGNAAPVAYITVAILTATTYTFGGLMREQVCIYMCPWPRIQAAMLDENSLVVTYNDWRGEPRGRCTPRRQRPRAWQPGGRLRRLQCLRGGVPDGHRHSRRPAARMHHLRTVHRCLRCVSWKSSAARKA
jgi:polyferredoxin